MYNASHRGGQSHGYVRKPCKRSVVFLGNSNSHHSDRFVIYSLIVSSKKSPTIPVFLLLLYIYNYIFGFTPTAGGLATLQCLTLKREVLGSSCTPVKRFFRIKTTISNQLTQFLLFFLACNVNHENKIVHNHIRYHPNISKGRYHLAPRDYTAEIDIHTAPAMCISIIRIIIIIFVVNQIRILPNWRGTSPRPRPRPRVPSPQWRS